MWVFFGFFLVAHCLNKPVALFIEQSFIPVHAELKNNTLFPV